MASFLNGLDSTLATVLLCALLFVDEAGLPMPLAPNEVLLLVAGLLIGTRTLDPMVFLPLALVALSAGMLSGFAWARLLGSSQLGSLARRLHAEKTYSRAVDRLRRANPLHIGLTRMVPGVRTYATLVAGAAGVELRRFLLGAMPALVVWLLLLTTLGAVIGSPAEHLIGEVDGLMVSGVLLVLLGAGAFLAVSRMPRAPRGQHPLRRLPRPVRLGLGLATDAGIIASLIAGTERLVARLVNPGHPFGRLNDAIIISAAGVIGYVAAARHAAGATLGEGLFDADYAAALRLLGRLRHRPSDSRREVRLRGRRVRQPARPGRSGARDVTSGRRRR